MTFQFWSWWAIHGQVIVLVINIIFQIVTMAVKDKKEHGGIPIILFVRNMVRFLTFMLLDGTYIFYGLKMWVTMTQLAGLNKDVD